MKISYRYKNGLWMLHCNGETSGHTLDMALDNLIAEFKQTTAHAPVLQACNTWAKPYCGFKWFYSDTNGHPGNRNILHVITRAFMGFDHTDKTKWCLIGETMYNEPIIGISENEIRPSKELMSELIKVYPLQWEYAQQRKANNA